MLRNIRFVAMLFIKHAGIFIFFKSPDNHFLIIPLFCQRFSKRQQLTANPLRLKRRININTPELKGLGLIRNLLFIVLHNKLTGIVTLYALSTPC